MPSLPAASTVPFPAATSLSPDTINSRATNITSIQPAISPRSTIIIMTAVTSSLSAIGSMNLPKSVTSPRERAICPSKKSVNDAAANSSTAISPHARPPAIISATITGIMHTRIIVSRLGRFTRTPPAGRTPPRR